MAVVVIIVIAVVVGVVDVVTVVVGMRNVRLESGEYVLQRGNWIFSR